MLFVLAGIFFLQVYTEVKGASYFIEALRILPTTCLQSRIVTRDGLHTLESLTWLRKILLVIVSLIRIFISMSLLYADTLRLARTSSVADLILNCCALCFVQETDELF